MPRIDPLALRKARTGKNWTQARLAEEAKIDPSTIWRLENGKCQNVRGSVLEKLGKVLGLSSAVLTGEAAYPDLGADDGDRLRRCQLNLRVDPSARNQLALVSLEYGVSQREIVELAPFLFDFVAQKSLKQRRERQAEMLVTMEAAYDKRDAFRHLPPELTNFCTPEEILAEERASIERKDLFGTTIKFDNDWMAPEPGYDESFESPFVHFLSELTNEMEGAKFTGWIGGPDYEIGRSKALQIMGGDEMAADAVMFGNALLHEMPQELRKKGQEAGRAQWALGQAEEARRSVESEFPGLDTVLADIPLDQEQKK